MQENRQRKYPQWFYLLSFFISIFFLFIIEISLQLFNYGENYSIWFEKDGLVNLNPLIAKKYFRNTEAIPYPLPDYFEKDKRNNSIRIFVIGESSTAGFPYSPNGTFSKYIRLKLESDFPSHKIEVINLAMAAINSYTFLDFVQSLLKYKPDAILIYGGHNEFYGALGVASSEYISNSILLNRFLLKIRNFKLYQLTENIIDFFTDLIINQKSSGTLMQRMVKDKFIPFNSELFNDGLNQFETNLSDILHLTKEKNIPVLIGTLVSNIKEQKPFISKRIIENYDANYFFGKAKEEELKNNFRRADSLYRLAKDYDLLKFRAPEKINFIIKSLSKKYKSTIVNIDSIFKEKSTNGLIGDNLMTDHLHPTLDGYKIIGESFYKKLINVLSKKIDVSSIKSKNEVNYSFTKLDSTIADFRIKILKNSWPYKLDERDTKNAFKSLISKSLIDSLAILVIKDKISWHNAHSILAEKYFTEKKYELYFDETEVLIDQFPLNILIYETAVTKLIKAEKFDLALKILLKQNKHKKTAFSLKWLGIIYLQKNNYNDAINYLEKSLTLNNNDEQVYYNLAGCYLMTNQIDKAKNNLHKCLSINPEYSQAKNLLNDINSNY